MTDKKSLDDYLSEAIAKMNADEDEDRKRYSRKKYTYDQWKELGFQVMKGQTYVRRTRSGSYLFAFQQVTKIYGRKSKE